MGVSNMPLLKYLNKKGAEITVFDNREEKDIPEECIKEISDYNMEHYFGKNSLENLHGFNMIFRAPSCMPNIKELEEERKKRSNNYIRNRNAYETLRRNNNPE